MHEAQSAEAATVVDLAPLYHVRSRVAEDAASLHGTRLQEDSRPAISLRHPQGKTRRHLPPLFRVRLSILRLSIFHLMKALVAAVSGMPTSFPP